MKTVICYETKNPMFGRNKFLAYYTNKNFEAGQAEAEKLNNERPGKLFNGQLIDWENVVKFYADKQEEMF